MSSSIGKAPLHNSFAVLLSILFFPMKSVANNIGFSVSVDNSSRRPIPSVTILPGTITLFIAEPDFPTESPIKQRSDILPGGGASPGLVHAATVDPLFVYFDDSLRML
jgi:hypothetical protein